jgi:hypothetical protein
LKPAQEKRLVKPYLKNKLKEKKNPIEGQPPVRFSLTSDDNGGGDGDGDSSG